MDNEAKQRKLQGVLLGAEAEEQAGKQTPTNREMKEGPTMLLITKHRFWEPTMFMKTNHLTRLSHDLYEKNGLSRFFRNSKRQGFQRGFSRPAKNPFCLSRFFLQKFGAYPECY
jgi:hypothetical protein